MRDEATGRACTACGVARPSDRRLPEGSMCTSVTMRSCAQQQCLPEQRSQTADGTVAHAMRCKARAFIQLAHKNTDARTRITHAETGPTVSVHPIIARSSHPTRKRKRAPLGLVAKDEHTRDLPSASQRQTSWCKCCTTATHTQGFTVCG